MYERRNEKLLTVQQFRARVLRHALFVAGAVATALAFGVIGYHSLGGLEWIDALVNASMILGGMGPVDPITSTGGKLFASFYAIFSGLFFIASSGVILAPFLHRLMHHFHFQQKGKDE